MCSDSKKSSTKKRGWASEYKNGLYISCFNCGYSASFQWFLKTEYPFYYQDYLKEKFEEKSYHLDSAKLSNSSQLSKPIDLFTSEYDSLSLQQIKDLPLNHKATQYLRNRSIPVDIYNEFYYSDNFSKYINTEIQPGLDYSADQDRRIIIPYYNKYKKIFVIQGCSIDDQSPKYMTIKTDKNADLIYGLDKVDFSKKVYITEGVFDSLMINNALAVSGALVNIDKLLKYTTKESLIILPDNDFNNKYTQKFQLQIIKKGFKIVLWNKKIPFKDLNEAIIKGYSENDLMKYFEHNTFQGLMAESRYRMRKL